LTARAVVFAGNALRAARKRGPFFLAGLGLRWATLPLWRRSWRDRTFTLGGETYPYLVHNYNLTWSNERAIEVPVAWREVERRPGASILEVGNVLAHYHRFPHDVVDKFERAAGVANLDVVDLPAAKRYDLVVTISTLEHVGFDEEPKDPEKPLRAMDALRRVLAPGGLLLATILVAPDKRTNSARLNFTLLFIAGCAAGALLLNGLYGISKNSATPSWCLWACAITAALWLGFYYVCDVASLDLVGKPFAIAGQNVLLAYLISEMLPSLLDLLHLGGPYWRFGDLNLACGITRSALCAALILLATAVLNRVGFRLKL